ncbi:MAG TPA: hypothetical protein VG498_06695 [Terriglobales bacterium]|nr:hypothetical protein [Terriglobales bacterium]
MFFVFFPERHKGTRTVEGNNTVVFTPDGGIEWRVTLDPPSFRNKCCTGRRPDNHRYFHFLSEVEGVQLENEIQKSAGDPSHSAIIRYTKTVINPPIDDSVFSIAGTPAQ